MAENRDRLDLTAEQIRAYGAKAVEAMANYYAGLPDRAIIPDVSSEFLRNLLREPLPESGAEFEELLRAVQSGVFEFSRHNGHPRFFGYVASPGNAVASMADMLASTLNSNVTSWRSGPAPTELEHVVIGWLKEMIGFPAQALGLFVSGGSMANFAGLAAARSAKAKTDVMRLGLTSTAMRLYASEEAHFSIVKAAGLLGIGQDNVRSVRTNERFEMDLADLEAKIRSDLAEGLQPFCIAASAGTTATGAFDPLPQIAEIARRYDLWLHVDAAYGGFAALAPSARHLFGGIDCADSVALDPHKWLYSSMGCGCVLYRDPDAARRTFGHETEYIRPVGWEHDEAFAFWDYGPELSRRFRALTVWFMVKYAGSRALGEAVERNIACAKELERLVESSADFEMLAPVGLSVFCFRYAPEKFSGDLDRLNERILVKLQAQGHSYVSNARVRGRFALRGCVLNFRTRMEDMRILLEDVRRAAAGV